MLAYGLAILVAIGSLLLYAIALRFPQICRRSDLLWSGVGLFYGLVLWVCGDQFVGALLLAQGAVVALLGWLLWQLLALRVQMARSLDPVGAESLPDFRGWLAWAAVFRPVDPSLSGWQAVRQSIVGFSLLLWMQMQSGRWRLPVAWSGAIGRAAAPSRPATPATPTTPTTSTAPAPPAPPVPVAPATGATATVPPVADPNAPKPVYVRKKYRQPAIEGIDTAPVPSPAPIAGGESKPVYVRKKYRQSAPEPEPAASPTPDRAPNPVPAIEPDQTMPADRPAPTVPDRPAPRPRPRPAAPIQLDGAKLPDEVVVDYEELPRRSPSPRRRPDRPR